MNRSITAIVALVCAAILFIGVNIIADKTLRSARVDLTQQRMFTLSDGSRHSLAFPKKTVVGLVTALPVEGDMMAAMQGRPMQPFAVIEQLRQLYEVRTIGSDLDKISPDIDVLMLIHPQNLSDKTQYAIDQFVLGGGRALVFVDPNSEIQQSRPSQ